MSKPCQPNWFSLDDFVAQAQWQKRVKINEKSLSLSLPSEMITTDILLEIIRGHETIIDVEKLSSRLKQRGVNIPYQQLIYALTNFDTIIYNTKQLSNSHYFQF